MCLGSQIALVNAQEKEGLTSIKGKIVLPTVIPKGINMEGLSLKGAEVILRGSNRVPRKPRAANWKELTSEEKKAWDEAFIKTNAYAIYEKSVKTAIANRFKTTTTLDENGNFSFEGIKPAWYQLTLTVSPPNIPVPYDDQDFSYCRAYLIKQFFVKDISRPLQMGTMRPNLKNVPMVGDMAADFTMLDYEGNSLKLSDFRGKHVLFDCWATWCGPCIAQMPYLEAVSEKHGSDKFITIGINVDEKIDDAKAYLKKKASHYKQVYAGDLKLHEAMSNAYGIESIPAIWLIGPDGKILARDLKGDNIAKEVEKALGAAKK